MNVSYVPRMLDGVLDRRLQHHPAILIVGPRAAGKTTTAARFASSIIRIDRPAEAAAVRADPDAVLRGLAEPVLIDEWQIVPEVLGAVKRSVDADPRPGRYLITGSVRGDVDSPTWPGTGRLLRVTLHGLTVGEIEGRFPAVSLLDRISGGDLDPWLARVTDPPDLRRYAELAVRGGFPEPALRLPPSERSGWFDSYIDQLLTRDLARLSPRRDPLRLRSYLEAYAIHSASVVGASTLQRAAGVAKATGEDYEELLRRLFVVDVVPAWWTNRLKRLVRSPKRYFVEPALAVASLRIDLDGLMKDGHLLGRVLDALVVAHLRSELPRCDSRPRIFHLRQQEGRQEVDVIVEFGGRRVVGIEVKATASPTLKDARHLEWLRDRLERRFLAGVVLHTGPRGFELAERIVAAPVAALWS